MNYEISQMSDCKTIAICNRRGGGKVTTAVNLGIGLAKNDKKVRPHFRRRISKLWRKQFKMPRNRIDRFYPAGTPAQRIEDTIVRALEMYRRRKRAMEQ